MNDEDDETLCPNDFAVKDLVVTVNMRTGETPVYEVVKTRKDALLLHNPRLGFLELEDGLDFRWVQKVDLSDTIPEAQPEASVWTKIVSWLRRF